MAFLISLWQKLVTKVQPALRRIVPQHFLLGVGIAVLLGGGGYWMYSALTSDSTADTAMSYAQVTRRTIVSSVKATGDVTFANEQELKFNQKGKVAKVFFQAGDTVKRGDIIAELDTSTIRTDIQQAALSVNASSLQLQQLRTEQVKTVLEAKNALKTAENSVKEAENTLAVAKEKLPSDIASAQRSVTEKEAAVKKAKAELEQARITTLQDLASTAQSILSNCEDLLDTLYGILVHDTSARHVSNQELEIYSRLYTDLAQKDAAARSYYAAVQAVDGMRTTYGNSLSSLRDVTELSTALAEAKEVAASVYLLADGTYQLTLGAVDDPSIFTVNDINALKQTTVSARSSANTLMENAETALASLSGGKNNITSIAITLKEDALQTAENALLAAQENLSILQTQTPGDLEKQEAALAKMKDAYLAQQASYEATTQGTGINDQLKQNDIAQKAASLQKTRKTLEDYQLTAPFDGVIRRMDYQVGDNLQDTGEDKYVVLENPAFIIVTVLLDQVDVVQVKKGMSGTIVLDAVPGQTFVGSIYEVDPTPQETSGVVSYEVSIKMDTPTDLTILSGMTATVEIEIMKREDVLTVPSLALQYAENNVSVQKKDGETVTVEIGETDGTYTEILSGLEEGDEVVALNTAIVTDSTASASTNARDIMRMTGGMGGGPPGM